MSKWFRKLARNPLGSACRRSGLPALENEHVIQSPHRLVVRTSRRGRDNPGSTPGVDRSCSGPSSSSRLPEGVNTKMQMLNNEAKPKNQNLKVEF